MSLTDSERAVRRKNIGKAATAKVAKFRAKLKIPNPKKTYWGFNVKIVEKSHKAKFVGDFCVKTQGGWSEEPAAVFYQPNPPELSPEGRPCSNYFGLYFQQGSLMICDAQSAFSEGIIGSVADNGEVVISRFRHDYQVSKDGSAVIDGARDYIKTNGCQTVKLKIDKHKLVVDGGS